MKLEVGKWYRNRRGALVGPLSANTNPYISDAYPFALAVDGDVIECWAADGRYLAGPQSAVSDKDLIEPAVPQTKEVEYAWKQIGVDMLCEDEGCDHFGAPHVCVSPAADLAADSFCFSEPAKTLGSVRVESTNPKDIVGAKKPPLMLIPPVGLVHEAMAFKNGAYTKGYGPFNWRKKQVGAMTYIGAILRHALSYLDGERCAADSGVHHLGHLRASASILLDAESLGNLVDDRPPPGKCAELIALLTETIEEVEKAA